MSLKGKIDPYTILFVFAVIIILLLVFGGLVASQTETGKSLLQALNDALCIGC